MPKRVLIKEIIYHVWHVDEVVNVEKVCIPILATEVLIGTNPCVPIRSHSDFIKQRGIKADHHRVGWCHSGQIYRKKNRIR